MRSRVPHSHAPPVTPARRGPQYQRPKHYWKTECWYALLSLLAKGTLGCILLANLLYQNAQEGSAGGSDNA